MNDDLRFASEAEQKTGPAPWLLLVVDDDPEVHAVTRIMLDNALFEGRGVSLLHARSAAEARVLLRQHPGIALALLDVVMETEHAGLELVNYIREELRYGAIRIILRTGQPGQAPPLQVAEQYEIDDYVSKAELTYERLRILIMTGLRSHARIRKLEHVANRDALTGLLNRRRFEQDVQHRWTAYAAAGQPVTALMIDVDHFKDYNDTYGHPEGDRMLIAVARTLALHGGQHASTCRYGGEEFLMLLAGAGLVQGIAMGDRLRQAVADLRLPHRGSPHGVLTISAGIGAIDPAQVPRDVGYRRLLLDADRALYLAKRSGRNRVEAASAVDVPAPGAA